MSRIFAIGDLHLSLNPEIDKPQDIFGGEWENYVEKLKKNWMDMVKDDDIVIICGDISWALLPEEALYDLRFIAELPGTKLIFKGNHDLWWSTNKKIKSIFSDDKMIFMKNDAYITEIDGKKIAIAGTRGWVCPGDREYDEHDEKMYRREIIRLKLSLDEAKKKNPDMIIGVLHYPPTNDKKQQSDFTRTMTEYGVKKCYYGHIHGKDNFKRGISGVLNGVEYFLVSFDYINGCPKEVTL
ncbi:MAG: metallophosphoesterase [Clostridia bacterium]|nr:metallophosphoesterase [Clostridia bacterium]